MLLASEDWASARGLKVQAYLTHAKVAAVDFVAWRRPADGADHRGAAHARCEPALTLQDFDFYEIHEAFAAQVLCTLRAWERAAYCRKKLGRADALGSIDRSEVQCQRSQPRARPSVRGDRHAHRRHAGEDARGKRRGRGLISICTAGGMGVTAILER